MADLPTDEARLALALELAQIADRVERSRCGLGVNERHVIDLGLTVAENLPTILVSLRTKTAGGAGEMRARAAEVVRYRGQRASMALRGEVMGAAGNKAIRDACANMASEIEAIPLDPSPQGEGGGE